MTRRSLLQAAFCFAAIAAAVPSVAQTPTVRVEEAWVRPPAPSRDVTGAYLTLVNDGAQPVRLVSATSARAKTVELHEMVMEGDVMRMRPVKEIVVPAKGRVTLRPGGLHLMLFGTPTPLATGAVVPLTLTLSDGRTIAADAVVRQPMGGMQ